MFSITLLLLISALIVCVMAAVNKAPLWVAVLLIILALLIGTIPLGSVAVVR